MNTVLEEKCKLFVENREELESFFKLELTTNISVGSIIYTQKNKKIDIERIKESYEILKRNQNALSDYRTVLAIPLITKMSLSENPEEYLNRVIETSNKIKSIHKGIGANIENTISAMILEETSNNENQEELIERAKNIFNLIKKEHPILTDGEDRTDAIVLAMSKKSDEKLIEDMETCYKILLNEKIGFRGSLQALSHILALSEKSPEEKCNKIIDINKILKQNKIKIAFETEHALEIMGLFVDLDIDNEKIVEQIIEIFEYIKKEKGMGKFSISNAERFIYSAAIFLNSLEEIKTNSILNTQIITELAVYTTVSALVAASTIIWDD